MVLPAYMLFTAVGDPDVLGTQPGWKWVEYNAVMAQNPQVISSCYRLDRLSQLYNQLILGGSDFIDSNAGKAHLESSAFVQLLEASAGYAKETPDQMVDPKPVYAARQALLRWTVVQDFRLMLQLQYEFDGSVVFKGYPSDSGNGSALIPVLRLGITRNCSDPDAAWAFLRWLLLPEFQNTVAEQALPLREETLKELATKACEPSPYANTAPYLSDLTEEQLDYWRRGLTEQECEQVMLAIHAADRLMQPDPTLQTILDEEASAYYAGVRSAREAAELMDNRIQLYLDEQS